MAKEGRCRFLPTQLYNTKPLMPPDDPHDLRPVFLDLGTVGIFLDVVWWAEYQLGKITALLGNKPVNYRPPQGRSVSYN